MNTKNNKRKKQSQIMIETTFVSLLEVKAINSITVSEICHLAKVNRSTFYANYLDVYDLVEKIKHNMLMEFERLYSPASIEYDHHYFLKLFYHIKENQLFYKTYFKLNLQLELPASQYNEEIAKEYFTHHYIDYHIVFFKAGLTALIKHWLEGHCQESPELLNTILMEEYIRKKV